jgi:hypothetical protein
MLKNISLIIILPIVFVFQDAGASDNSVLVGNVSRVYMPNYYAKSLTVPTAWGASGNVLFMSIGGTSPSAYSPRADGAACMGYGLGNPKKIAFHAALVSLDMDQWDNYSLYIHCYKNVSDSGAIGVGAENVMLTKGGDTLKSFYVVYSTASQSNQFANTKTMRSKLTYTIGCGTGRFYKNSSTDIANGKNKYGSSVFGAISYELAQHFNAITEWNGLNMSVGMSTRFMLDKHVPLSLICGMTDLTRNSGDRARFIASLGIGYKL